MLWATSSSPPIHDSFVVGKWNSEPCCVWNQLKASEFCWRYYGFHTVSLFLRLFSPDNLPSHHTVIPFKRPTPNALPSPNLTFRASYKVRAVEAHCCWCPSSCFSCSIFLWQRNPRNGHWNWENHPTIAVRLWDFPAMGKKPRVAGKNSMTSRMAHCFKIALRNEAARTFFALTTALNRMFHSTSFLYSQTLNTFPQQHPQTKELCHSRSPAGLGFRIVQSLWLYDYFPFKTNSASAMKKHRGNTGSTDTIHKFSQWTIQLNYVVVEKLNS